MSLGKGGSNTTVTTTPSPEQQAQIAAQTGFNVNTLYPAYNQLLGQAKDVYNATAPGQNYAAQNLAGVAGQVQDVAGSTGQSALQTGVSGLENLFGPQYQQQQLAAAMAPAESQYQQNLQGLNTQFGGAGMLGSSRSALANQQLAGLTQQQMATTAAGINQNIAQQQLAASQSLAGIGTGGLNQALGAAGQGVAAAGVPLSGLASLAGILYGAPQPNLPTIGQSTTTSGTSTGVNLGFKA